MLKNLLLTFLVFPLAVEARASSPCPRPPIFFDLGQTLVDTDTNKYNPMFYLRLDGREHSDALDFPTAREYLGALVEQGYKLGLLADIPGDWGVNYPAQEPIRDLPTAKVVRTMDFITGIHPEDGSSWIGVPFDWNPFVKLQGDGSNRLAVGRVLLPQSNNERKGKGALVRLDRAVAIAQAEGCPAIYQGEQENEMILAEKAGMIPFWVGHTVRGQFFLRPGDVKDYVSAYKSGAWRPGPK